MNLDTRLFFDVNDFARATPWLHSLLVAYAAYGVVLFGLILLAAWWIARSRQAPSAMAAALWAPIGMLLAIAVNVPLSGLVGEPRPFVTLPHILVLARHSPDPSFPSDHCVMAGAVAAGVFLVSRRLGLVAALAAVLMAFSRVYIAVHYPQDVLAGLVVGAVVTLLGYALTRRVMLWFVASLERGPLRPLVSAAGTPAPAA